MNEPDYNHEPIIRATSSDGERHYEDIRYLYQPDELTKLGQQLATENQAVYNLEKEKKTTTADMASRIKAANAQAETTTTKINNGYEMRNVEVMFLLNDPRPGWKTVIRCDTTQPIREELMTPSEKQEKLF